MFENPERIVPNRRIDELWFASALLDLAAEEDAAALAVEETAEDDAARQLRS